MPTYNTANVLSAYQGYSESDWNSLANDVTNNGMLSAFQSRFTMAPKYVTTMGFVPTATQNAFAAGCLHAAHGAHAGWAFDFSGLSISDTSTGSNWTYECELHFDIIVIYTGGLPGFTISFWNMHTVS